MHVYTVYISRIWILHKYIVYIYNFISIYTYTHLVVSFENTVAGSCLGSPITQVYTCVYKLLLSIQNSNIYTYVEYVYIE